MSMADDNTVRSYRSNDLHRRNTDPAEAQDFDFSGSDPLAELARLIGQNDPYTNTARRQPQSAAPRTAPRDEHAGSDWRKHVQRPDYAREEPGFDPEPRYAPAEPRYGSAEPRHTSAEARYRSAGQRYADPEPRDDYADHDPYRMPSSQYEDRYPDPHVEDRYADPHADDRYDRHAEYRHDPSTDYRHDPAYAPAAADEYPDEQMYADAPQQTRGPAGGGHHHSGLAAHADEDYDDPPLRRKKSGSGLVTAVVLVGCAMLGTAGAYGYRTYATSSESKQAPVIIADNSPSKVVPAEQQSRSQDRGNGQGGDEQLVSREEQPVSLQPPGNSAVPRVVFPSPVQPAPSTTGSTPSASNGQASTQVDQPKRVRTVPIRPEGGDGSARPSSESRAAAPPPAARTAPQPQSRASRDQPLSLDPNAPAQANEPAPAQRLAAVPPAASGGFLVQVSSQRSEADAQASYRALQGKYSQLKSHQPLIRRADLGNKGVYYRAMVGPFESGEEAVQFCNGLKQAGGQCIIHRN
jgi:SPOR domain